MYEPRPWIAEAAGVFVLDRRMKGVSPANGAIADARQPVLKWPAVAGATHYRGDFRGGEKMKWFDVDEPQYVIGGGLDAGEWCGWRVVALDANDKTLARGQGSFLGHGTDQATIEKMRAAGGGTCGVPPSPGRAYLGIQPLPIQVPKDAATPLQDERGAGMTYQDDASRFIPGILVVEVSPGSPAVDADLHIYDVITAVDGQPVPSENGFGDIRTFIEQMVAMAPGRQITVTVRRFPRQLTLHATIGRYPGARPGNAARDQSRRRCSRPRSRGRQHAKAERHPPRRRCARPCRMERLAWRSPALRFLRRDYSFRVDAGADIPLLSTKEGLASNWVNCMVELPHGGMAFGTRDGLSIWDGAEIRTYTGPAFSGQLGGTAMTATAGFPPMISRTCSAIRAAGFGWRPHTASAGSTPRHREPGPYWKIPSRQCVRTAQGVDQTVDVQKIFETSEGTIVLGARSAAITLIDPKTDTPQLIHSDGEMNHWITGIAEDRQHRLWFAVHGVGVLRYDGAKMEQIHGPWIVGDDLRGLCIDRTGTIWANFGNSGLGALHADGTTERVNPDPMIWRAGYVRMVSTDRAGRVWATCDYGICRSRDPDDAQGKNKPWKFFGGDGDRMWYVLNTSDGSSWVSGAGISRTRNLQLTTTNPRAAAVDRIKRDVGKSVSKGGSRSSALSPWGQRRR